MDIDDDKDTGQSMTMLKTMLVLTLMLMLTGASMARLLTDSDTEAMIQRVQPEERDEVKISIVCLCCLFSMRAILLVQQTLFLHTQQVNVLIEKHKELRRKKSANSFRREGVTQVSWKTHTFSVEPGFTSEAPGAEWSADLKRGPAPHRPDRGEGGEQHGSLTGARGGGPPLRYE